jgi:dihydropteroate synthase
MLYSIRALSVKSPEDAERELAALNIDRFGIRNMGPKMLHRLLLIERIGAGEAGVLKSEILALGGDAAVGSGRGDGSHAETSVILMGTLKQLRSLCAHLHKRAFGLPSLASDILRVLDADTASACTWNLGSRSIDLSRRACIMGVLNVTPDSFSDGNRYFMVERALERAFEMEAEGADIIDIGGESTRPFASQVDADEELRRVMPVIEGLSGRLKIPISIDTFKAAVAREALAAGAVIVNDISALTFDDRMGEVVSAAGAGLVLMHTRGRPADMQKDTVYSSIMSEVIESLKKSLLLAGLAGIESEHIIVDPGIGFGKNAEGNCELIRRLAELSTLGRPVMVGTSRKSFIGAVLDRPVGERIFGTAATVAVALANGASLFRVHDVGEMRDTVDMAMALLRPPAGLH